MINWTIGKRIAGGFACVIFIALALGVVSYSLLTVIGRHSDEITDLAIPLLEQNNEMAFNAKSALQAVYMHIGSDDKADMARLDGLIVSAAAANAKVLENLATLITSAEGVGLLDKIQSTRADYAKIREEVMELSRQATNNALAYGLARTKLDPACDRYLAAIEALNTFGKAEASSSSKSIQAALASSKAGTLIGLALALVIGLGLGWAITRTTTRLLKGIADSLNSGFEQVVSAAGQVSSSSQSLAQGASTQAASLEETSSSLEEMSSMAKRNSEGSQKANDLAKQARSAAEKGAVDMQEMSAAIEAINASSSDIAKIIKTIDEIAFQTNILALNAAVEAARAGEAGMGFAVVAEEVKSLAQRSAQAAKETSAKIEGAIGNTARGVEISNKVEATLNEIVTRVKQVDELVAEVAGASNEQTQGVAQINLAVTEMDKVTQGNAASAEEGAAAAEELNAQAETMKDSVTQLLRLVQNRGSAEMKHAETPSAGFSTSSRASRPSNFMSGRSSSAKARGAVTAVKTPVPEATPASRGRAEIPMDEDFKSF